MKKCCNNCEHLKKFDKCETFKWYVCDKIKDHLTNITDLDDLEIRIGSIKVFCCSEYEKKGL